MTNSRNPDSFASQLLQQEEALRDSNYKDYRMKLERALATAQRREKIVGWVCVVSFIVGLTLMFVGGSRIIGDFDPWSKEANVWSVAAGVVYIAATVLFWLSLASYFSRFRPKTREAKERIRNAAILELQRQVYELQRQIAPPSAPSKPEADTPRSADA